MRICFVGLGTMGSPMARQLEKHGFPVAGWDVSDSAGPDLKGRCKTLEAAMEGADVVWTMLPEGQHVADIHKSVLAMPLDRALVFADSSTIDVPTTRELAQQAETAGHGFIDAPVSGGAEGARAGTLSFMVGGEERHIAFLMPALDTLGAGMKRFGMPGTGQAAKACHNMICGITALGVCEAFALAESLDLDPAAFFELCSSAAAQSWILENRCPVPGLAPDAPSSNGYAPGFAAKLMAKDLRLARATADAVGQSIPFGAEAARRFSEFARHADTGDLDFSAIYETMRSN